MGNEIRKNGLQEREIVKKNGIPMLILVILEFLVATGCFVAMGILESCGILTMSLGIVLGVSGGILIVVGSIYSCGFHLINPNEAMVFTLFGEYYGTIKKEGFYFINPFAVAMMPAVGKKKEEVAKKKVSLKTMTLNNQQQKVNDALGNPIIIGAIVIWKVVNPTKALIQVDNYQTFLSIQCDSTIRNVARLYPYDLMEEEEEGENHEKTLRGSSQEIAESMKAELEKRVAEAGIVVEEVRITHLAYAEEIAAAMLQRQQATAIIAARKKIVEGAVGMVDMAIEQLGEKEVVVLDEERKAAMVSNLLVVLCGHQEAQPIVNSGSIY